MQFRNVVAVSIAVAIVSASALGAQGGPGGRSSGPRTPPPDEIADVSKGVLRSIKLTKQQGDSVKVLNTAFAAQEKELNRLAQMVGGTRSGGGGGSRSGGSSSSRGGSGASNGGGVTPQLRVALADLHSKFALAVRAVMTEEQRPVFDTNLVAYQKKVEERQMEALRGRG